MIPIAKIIDYVSAIKDLLGDDYSVQLTIQKNEEHVEPDEDDLQIDPRLVPDVDDDKEESTWA